MSQKTKQLPISKLNRGVFGVHLKGRIIRKWKKETLGNKGVEDYSSMEILLVDEEGDVIQLTATRALIQAFDGKLEEGKCYNIGRFQIILNKGYDIATPYPCRIRLGSTSTIEEIKENGLPQHGFNLVSFDDIISDNLSGRFFIDVIAEVESNDVIYEVNDNKRTRLFLEDINGEHLQLWLWGSHVQHVIHISTDRRYKVEKPVVVLQCVQRTVHRGEVRLNTTDATKVLIDPYIPEVLDYKIRIPKRPTANRGLVEFRSTDLVAGNLLSLADVLSCAKAGTYVTRAYITEIDDTYKWFYNSCKRCKSRAGIKDGLWYCSKEYCVSYDAGEISCVPRFQAKFIIEDGNGGQATVKMFENLVQRKIKKSARECIEALRQVGNEHGIPDDFQCFFGNEYLLKIEVHRRFNIEMNSTCYTVYDFTDDKETITKWNNKYAEMEAASIVTKTTSSKGAISGEISMIDRTPRRTRKYTQTVSDDDEPMIVSEVEDRGSSSKTLKQVKIEKDAD